MKRLELYGEVFLIIIGSATATVGCWERDNSQILLGCTFLVLGRLSFITRKLRKLEAVGDNEG